MKASKITHRSVARIRVDFPYNQEMVSLLRQIADARWSKTLGAWHIPYTKEAFGQLKALFPNLEMALPTLLTILLPPSFPTADAPTPKPKALAPVKALPPIWVAVDMAFP